MPLWFQIHSFWTNPPPSPNLFLIPMTRLWGGGVSYFVRILVLVRQMVKKTLWCPNPSPSNLALTFWSLGKDCQIFFTGEGSTQGKEWNPSRKKLLDLYIGMSCSTEDCCWTDWFQAKHHDRSVHTKQFTFTDRYNVNYG